MELLSQSMGRAVTNAFKELLSQKHLYQSTEVDFSQVLDTAKLILEERNLADIGQRSVYERNPQDIIRDEVENTKNGLWVPRQSAMVTMSYSTESPPVSFDLPTINTFCTHCADRWPFNPEAETNYLVRGNCGQDECFYLGYQCQQCKGEPVRFLVRREGLKLRLAGRYPLEVLPTPKMLPKTVSKYYSNAVILHHAGQTLPALFLLRVFIEQFWRTIPEIQLLFAGNQRVTGDELGNAYQGTLPNDFKGRFPSLSNVYAKLSAAIHTASGDATLFDESCAEIVEHFDALRVFKLFGER